MIIAGETRYLCSQCRVRSDSSPARRARATRIEGSAGVSSSRNVAPKPKPQPKPTPKPKDALAGRLEPCDNPADQCELCLRRFINEPRPFSFSTCENCYAAPSHHHGRCCVNAAAGYNVAGEYLT